jgi:hypothetical protein
VDADEGDHDDSQVHDVEFAVSGEDLPAVFDAAEDPLDFVAPLVKLSVILPGVQAVGLRGTTGLSPAARAASLAGRPS